MAFSNLETSLESGQPTRNFEFSRGPLRWYYTTADRDITIDSRVFRTGSGISDSGMQFTGEPSADTYLVTMSSNTEVPLMFRGLPPSDPINLKVWDYHYGDDTWIISWVGVIKGCKWPSDEVAELACQSIAAALDVPGLRLGWQRSCPYTLYRLGCNVDPNIHRVLGSIIAMDGLRIEVVAALGYPDGWFSGGMVEWPIGAGVYEARGIRQHTGASLLLLGGTYGAELTYPVRLYPGCNRTIATCSAKFNNDANYGGQPQLPGRSPFDGNRVW